MELLSPLGSRAFDIVEVLARSAGELVTKDEIMLQVWSGAIVEESALQVHISAIRRALGPDRGMLKTAFGRGFVGLELGPFGRSAYRPLRSSSKSCRRLKSRLQRRPGVSGITIARRVPIARFRPPRRRTVGRSSR
jgi:hypothetical protein